MELSNDQVVSICLVCFDTMLLIVFVTSIVTKAILRQKSTQKEDRKMPAKLLPTLLTPIPEGMSKGWSLAVNGQPVTDLQQATLYNPRFGALFYGKSPSGSWDQWSFHEVGGGGSVIVPFAIRDGQLFIGVVKQSRPLQESSKPVLNLPRGFLDPGETHFEAAQREAEEEIGQLGQSFSLPGEPANPNNAFFETWGEGEGVKFFGTEVGLELLKEEGDKIVLDESLVKPVSKGGENIMKALFIPWTSACFLADQMTLSGVARLLAHLVSEGKF